MKKSSCIKFILFGVYCVIMLLLLFRWPQCNMGIPHWPPSAVNYSMIPFQTIRKLFAMLKTGRKYLSLYAVHNLAGNILLYLPLGALLPMLTPKLRKLWKTALVCFAVIVLVESIQFVDGRVFADVDDVILNLPGAAAGYGIWKLASSLRKRKARKSETEKAASSSAEGGERREKNGGKA